MKVKRVCEAEKGVYWLKRRSSIWTMPVSMTLVTNASNAALRGLNGCAMRKGDSAERRGLGVSDMLFITLQQQYYCTHPILNFFAARRQRQLVAK